MTAPLTRRLLAEFLGSAFLAALVIGAAYWFTSSTSFANPAISVGRIFSDTFAGIAPASVPSFVVAQLVGGVIAAVVVPHDGVPEPQRIAPAPMTTTSTPT